MKFLKVVSVAALAVAALMAFASSVSATAITVTTEDGTLDTVNKGVAVITAELSEGEAILKSSFIGEVKCKKSSASPKSTNLGSATETIVATAEGLSFSECNGVVTVLKHGTLEIHTDPNDVSPNFFNGTVTSTGAEVTVELAGLHCIFSTSNTHVGTITGTHTGHVTLTAASAAIPRTGGRSGAFCGSSATWNAKYTVTTIHWEYEPGKTFTATNFTIH